MNEQNFTSLELSKKLAENGCKLESEYRWFCSMGYCFVKYKDFAITYITPAYDILNDICVKYAKEFFGEELDICSKEDFIKGYVNKTYAKDLYERIVKTPIYIRKTKYILHLLQQNKKEEAEKYFWEHTIFNPKNK